MRGAKVGPGFIFIGIVSVAAVLAVLGFWVAAAVAVAVGVAAAIVGLRQVFREAGARVDRAFDVLVPQPPLQRHQLLHHR